MNEIVKASINGRKEAFFNAYEINDDEIKAKIEDLFKRINTFGEEHEANFEADFLSSPLNQEYIDLFTFVATRCKAKVYESSNNVKSDSDYVKDEIASEIKYQAKEATFPLRRKVREKVESEMRDLPIIGDAMTVKQHVDFFGRFKKKDE
jgi:hypothetical protein